MILLQNSTISPQWVAHKSCIQRNGFAYGKGRYSSRPFLGRIIPSDRPEQFLQLKQIAGFLLPTLDANVPNWVAGAMQ